MLGRDCTFIICTLVCSNCNDFVHTITMIYMSVDVFAYQKILTDKSIQCEAVEVVS